MEQRILIRTAENEKDYHGGGNHYTDLDKMREDVQWPVKTKR